MNLRKDIILVPSSQAVCYILLPMCPADEMLEWIRTNASEYAANMVVLSGMDWNRDMSPWPAPAVFSRESDFGGKATDFLNYLLSDVIPAVERELAMGAVSHRRLVGISLSGLFALWASCQTNAFHRVASLSGSLWYDGFAEWMAKQTPHIERAYLSLGNREKLSRNVRMATVEDTTIRVAELLKCKGVETVLELNPGTHFAPLLPRMEKALKALK